MAGPSQNPSRPSQYFMGLDLRSSDLLRNPDAATEATNVIFRRTENFSARPGYRGVVASNGGLGMAKYVYQSATTGADTVEDLIIGTKLHKLTSGSLAITYSGSGASVYCDCYVIGDQWTFRLVVDDVVVYSKYLGLGFDEASPVSLSTLRSEIDALADFAATLTGASQAAAFLPTLVEEYFSAGALTISYEYETEINQPTSAANPFASAWAARNTSSFEFPTFCNANNLIYLGSRYDDEHKYDGQKIYRSGVPQPTVPSALVSASGSGRTGTNIRYRISFVQVDNRGNRNEGIISDESGTVSPAADNVDVTYTALAATSGFNTDCGMFAGAQVTQTTLNVDNGSGGSHTLKIGDTAYFYDSVSAAHVSRLITNVAATTITIAGAAVTVADNAPVSANLRVALYTQAVASGDYYLVDEFPHNRWITTPVIRDLGPTLGAQYIFPVAGADPGLPPRGHYRAMYRGLKFISGILGNTLQDGVYYSDITSPESYSTDSNSFDVKTNFQSKHSGLFPTNDYLLIAKNNSTHVLVGDNDENGFFQYRVDELSLSVGASGQGGFQQISDGSVLWLNERGVFITKAGALPQEVSAPILPAFNAVGSEAMLRFSRAQSAYDINTWRYYLFIPAETSSGGSVYANTYSKLFVFDFSLMERDGPVRITEFKNVNAGCGAIIDGENIYFCERRLSTYSSSVAANVYKFNGLKTGYDQVDHSTGLPGVTMEYACGWDDFGDPSVFKTPLRLKVFSIDPIIFPQFSLNVQTEINFVSSPVCENTFTFGSETGTQGYDLDAYDSAPYDPPGEPEVDQKLARLKCKSWRHRFLHGTRYELPVISGWQNEVSLTYRSKIKE